MNRLIIHITNTAILLALLAGVFPAQAVFAERMTSGSYTLESDSVNFAGARSTSGAYNLEDTAGEVGTGDLTSANNNAHIGFQQASSTAAAIVAPTPTPSATPVTTGNGGSSSSGGGASGSFFPVNVTNFSALAGESSILLDWLYPEGADIVSVRIVRSDKFFPSTPSEGEVVFEGDALQVIDHDVVLGKTYYYALFAKNSKGLYSSGVLAQAKIVVVGTEPLPTDIFAGVPITDNVHPAIAALTLLDFDFIQDGRKIEHTKDGVVIDAKKNLTVQLDYKKLPEILKTVAISLADPNDSTKIFTFLLRVNKAKNVYEATIAPLGGRGIYKLNAIILDYQNQGLKRITGNIRALALDSVEGLVYEITRTPTLIYFFIFLLILIALIVILRKRKNHKAVASATMIGLILFTVVSVIPVHAAINKEINYQGKLANTADETVNNGTYQMEFKLYTQPSGGAAIWTETLSGANEVQVTNGLFSVLLGQVTTLNGVDFNQTLYLGVNIENDGEMTPRKKLGAVPAAFVADTLDGIDSTTFLRIDQGNITSGYFVATSTTASTFPYASTTALSATTLCLSTDCRTVWPTSGSGANFDWNKETNYGALALTPTTTIPVWIKSNFYASSSAVIAGNILTTNITATGTLNVGGLTSLASLNLASYNGPLQANNGLVSATSSIGVLYGGTGLTAAPAFGNILVGNNAGGYTLTATSSLGLLTISDVNLFINASTTIPKTYVGNIFTNSNAFTGSTTVNTLLATGSTTLQNFTGLNATTTNATSTTLFSTLLSTNTLCIAGDCRVLWPTGSGSGSFDFTPTTNYGINVNSTTSPIWFRDQIFASSTAIFGGNVTANSFIATGTVASILPYASTTALTVSGTGYFTNILATGSTTLQNFTGLNSTTTNATSTSLFTTTLNATNLTAGTILATGSTTLQNFTGRNATTTNATSTNLFAGNFVTTNGTSTSFFAGSASTTNLFATAITAGLINGQNISSAANFTGTLNVTSGLTTLSNLLLTGSTTLQNFTGLNATTTNATSTTLFSTLLSTNTLCISTDCRTAWPANAAFAFTPTTNYGVNVNSTTSPLWFRDQIFASSTAIIGGNVTANSFIATGTVASILPYASTTALSAINLFASNFILNSLNGPLQANNGVVSATSSIGVLYGGTGLSVAPSYGQILVGNNTGGYTLTATSSLGITSQWTTSGANIFYNTGNVGIGTSSPYAKLSVAGGVVADSYNATSTTATSTFAGGLSVGGGALQYDFSTGITSIDNLTLGAMSFDTNAGMVSWSDLPVDSGAAFGTPQGYSAQIGGNPLLTLYSVSNGVGGVTNLGVGIGTTSPYAPLSVVGQVVASYFTATTSTASIFPYASTTALTAGNLFASNFNLGSLNGPLQAINGLVSATSTLSSVYGGTGFSSFTTGDLLYASNAAALAKLGIGGNGTCLTSNGTQPAWGSCGGGAGSGSGTWSTTTSNVLGQFINYPNNASDIVAIGGTSTTSAKYFFDPNAQIASLAGAVTVGGNLTIGSLNGPLQAINGLVSATSTLSVAFGGSGLSTAPSFGNILVGNNTGGYTLTATSSLGLVSSQWTTSGANIFYNTGNVGIGTSSPYARLSVVGAGGIVAESFNATSTTATSTFAGGLDVGNGGLVYDFSTGITSIASAQFGSMNFDDDAGVIGWINLPVTSAAADLVQSFTASIDDSPLLTLFGLSDGAGGVNSLGVSIGSTSPYAKLGVWGSGTTNGKAFEVANAASSTIFSILDRGLTTLLYGSSTAFSATTLCISTDCRTAWPANAAFAWTPTTNYGINVNSTTSPLWFRGQIFASSTAIFGGNVTANSFIATGTVASILPYASTTALTVSGTGYFTNILATGSTTLQNFTGLNSTTTNATSTSLFTTTLNATNLTSGAILATGSTTLQNFTGRNATTTNATSTSLFTTTLNATGLTSGTILATGSTTLQNFTGLNATTTNATSTTIFSTLLSTNTLCIAGDCRVLWPTGSNGGFVATTNYGINVNSTTSPLWFRDQIFASSTAIFGGNVTANSFIATGTVASILPYASTTALTVSGTGYFTNILATGSTTLQNFTGLNSTTTNATSTSLFTTTLNATNLTAGTILATGSTTLQNFTGRNATTTNATSTTTLFAGNCGHMTNGTSTSFFTSTASSTKSLLRNR
jgi:hypothetical protein